MRAARFKGALPLHSAQLKTRPLTGRSFYSLRLQLVNVSSTVMAHSGYAFLISTKILIKPGKKVPHAPRARDRHAFQTSCLWTRHRYSA